MMLGRVMWYPSPTSPVLGVYLLQTKLVHIVPDVFHPPHSWSYFCLSTSHFHLHRLLHLISVIPPQHVTKPSEPCLPHFQFIFPPRYPQFSPNCVALICFSKPLDLPQHSHFCCFQESLSSWPH